MPNYSYQCVECNNEFEKYFSYKEELKDYIPCTKCKGKSKRKVSLSPIIYKGSGFYTTDKEKSL